MFPPLYRHNSFWGKMAPSRLNSKIRSRSEPNLPKCLLREQRSNRSPEFELPFLNEDEDTSHNNKTNVIPLKSFSQLPSQLMSVDKDTNIKNFLASLPSLQTIDDDQGIGENTYTSESGSGSSSPILTPTDDEQFHLRHRLLKEIKDKRGSKRRHDKRYRDDVETGSSPTEFSGGYYSQTSSQVTERVPSLTQSYAGIPPKPAPPATSRTTKSKTSPPPSCSSSITTPMLATVRQPIARTNQLPYKIVRKTVKAASVPHDLALTHNFSALPSSKLATISPESSKTSLSSMVTAQPEEGVEDIDEQPEESIMITVTDSKEELVETLPSDEEEIPTRAKEHEGHTRQSSDGVLPSMTSSATVVAETVSDMANQQHRRAKSDGDNISGPTQIPSVPDRVKEIEEMSGGVVSSTQGGSSVTNSGAPSPGVIYMNITPSSDDKQPSVGSSSVTDDKQQSVSSMSRSSSEQSLSSDCELEELAQSSVKSNSPRCIRSTRHGSLSPNPPSLQMKVVTEQTRCTSLMYLPHSEQEQQQQQQNELSDDNLASSLMGAVKARVQDIEEKNRDSNKSQRSKASPEKGEPVKKVTPPPVRVVQRPSTSSAVASSTNDDAQAETLTSVRRHSTTAQLRRPSSEILVEDESRNESLAKPRMGRRESTPPALFSAWNPLVSADGIPRNPVQDLKQKFEESTQESKAFSKSTEAHPQTRALDIIKKVGSNLRRSQSLRTVGSPSSSTSQHGRKRKKPSCEESLSSFTPVSDTCSQD